MTKIKVLLLVLIVCTASVGITYAKSGNKSVGATVEAGSLQIDVVGTAIGYDGYVTAQKSVSADGRSVTFTIDRLHPGAEIAIHVKAINTGNLAVAFDNALLTWDGNLALKPYLEALSGFQYDGDGNGTVDGGQSFQPSWTNLDPIATAMNNSAPLKNMVLGSGGAFYLGTPMDGAQGSSDYPLKIRLSADAPNEMQNTSVTFKLMLNWKQATFNSWTGQVEVRWRKVPRENTDGWDVYGDVYLIYQDGSRSREPYKTINEVKKYFSSNEATLYKSDAFFVEVSGTSNHYQVEVPKEPPAGPEIVNPKK